MTGLLVGNLQKFLTVFFLQRALLVASLGGGVSLAEGRGGCLLKSASQPSLWHRVQLGCTFVQLGLQ